MLYKKRCRKIERYARRFCDKVRSDFTAAGGHLTADYPRIRVHRRFGVVPAEIKGLEAAEKTISGDSIINGLYFNGHIELFGITKSKPEILKRTIRHECLHFLLEKSGLPCKDGDDIFIALAILYNANPYRLHRNPEVRELFAD